MINQLNHLAVVMDGNRRWARQNNLLENLGYSKSFEVVKKIFEYCIEEKIPNLTLYAFSTENWSRPKKDIIFIFKLLENAIDNNLQDLIKNNIRLNFIGNLELLDNSLKEKLLKTQFVTKDCSLLCVNIAISYGARDEIVRSVNKLLESKLEINEKNINKYLDIPLDVDLLIRVGGAKRLSNFLLWQCSYAEIYFSDTFFPAFKIDELKNIVKDFKKRKRTFGR